MSKEETKGEDGEIAVPSIDEEVLYEDAKRRLVEANSALAEENSALATWKLANKGVSPINEEWLPLNQAVKHANQSLMNATQILNDAKRRWNNTRAASGQGLSEPSTVLTKWETTDQTTNQPYHVDPREYTLSDNSPNTIVVSDQLSHFFNEYGTFPSEYFVRLEETKLWEMVLAQLKGKTEPIVLVGSPGVGKSIFLMVLSFYVAFAMKRKVLILRNLSVEEWCYLYIEELGFKRGTYEASEFVGIRRTFDDAWVFLDGFTYYDVHHLHSSLLCPFRILATSCQYKLKSADSSELVVLPAWRFEGLCECNRLGERRRIAQAKECDGLRGRSAILL